MATVYLRTSNTNDGTCLDNVIHGKSFLLVLALLSVAKDRIFAQTTQLTAPVKRRKPWQRSILCFGNVIHGKRLFYAQATQCTTKASFFVLATLSIAKDLIFSQATQTTVPILTTRSTAKALAFVPPTLSLENVFSTHNAMHGMCSNYIIYGKSSVLRFDNVIDEKRLPTHKQRN